MLSVLCFHVKFSKVVLQGIIIKADDLNFINLFKNLFKDDDDDDEDEDEEEEGEVGLAYLQNPIDVSCPVIVLKLCFISKTFYLLADT